MLIPLAIFHKFFFFFLGPIESNNGYVMLLYGEVSNQKYNDDELGLMRRKLRIREKGERRIEG